MIFCHVRVVTNPVTNWSKPSGKNAPMVLRVVKHIPAEGKLSHSFEGIYGGFIGIYSGFIGIYSVFNGIYKLYKLVGGIPTPLKNDGVRQLG